MTTGDVALQQTGVKFSTFQIQNEGTDPGTNTTTFTLSAQTAPSALQLNVQVQDSNPAKLKIDTTKTYKVVITEE
jgi:hypothetical protein